MRVVTTFILAAFSLGSTALPNPTSTSEQVRFYDIMEHLESMNYIVPWERLSNNTTRVNFKVEDLVQWESEILAKRGVTGRGEGSIWKVQASPTPVQAAGPRAAQPTNRQCYGSGSWAKSATLSAHSGGACRDFGYDVEHVMEFQFVRTFMQENAAGDTMDIVWSAYGTHHSSEDDCNVAMQALIWDMCKGQNQDTRGGEAGYSSVLYGVDPTTHNCNC